MGSRRKSSDEQRILYGFWLSPFMSLVAHFLEEADMAYAYERVSPFTGDTISDRHRSRNPLGKIPTLADARGAIISESQAICRYLARSYPEAQRLYPCHDPERCARVDALNDFLTFSISGPFFNWFVVGAYYPQAFRLKTEQESRIFSLLSMVTVKGALGRLADGSVLGPFLLGRDPVLPDFHLFHILELGKTFSEIFEMPEIDLLDGNAPLRAFHDAMLERPSTRKILEEQAAERAMTEREIFEEFGKAYADMLKPARQGLQALFGHEV